MKKSFFLLAGALGFAAMVQAAGRDVAVVREYIQKAVGNAALTEIKRQEGGADFLKRFFADQEWMEEFAGSGPWCGEPAKALRALDLLVWNDRDDFIKTKIGRNCATALALNHGDDYDDEKLVEIMECYREWEKNLTLHVSAGTLDTRQWREVVCFGQNAGLSVENLRWIHNYATLPNERYHGICWTCHYRLRNCFGDSVHGPLYYRPWEHRWNTQELRYRVGGVCGALSKFGSHCAASHGIRSFTAGQPGHCAFMLWNLKADRWDIAYSVTSHTGSHFTLGGQGFVANEEQDRYFRNPKRMDAEFLRWKGQYEKSMRTVNGNWQAAVEWIEQLKQRNAPKTEWDVFAKAVLETFNDCPSQGWQLYFKYMDALKAKNDRVEAAIRGLKVFKENPAKTAEALYFDEKVMEPLSKYFADDSEILWKLLPLSLVSHGKSANFYRQIINWAAGKLMTSQAATGRFLSIVTEASAKTGMKLDYRGMILKAAEVEDIAMFHQIYSVLDKLSPGDAPKPAKDKKKYPKSDYGGELLSCDGLLKLDSTCVYDCPVNYRNTLNADDFEGQNGFHTDKGFEPWAMVVLPGDSEITGLTIVDKAWGTNADRQFPMVISFSTDGKQFTQVHRCDNKQSEVRVEIPGAKKAKYIKIGRAKSDREEPFHLHKILVYGKKLY